jgi:hypothetical protein
MQSGARGNVDSVVQGSTAHTNGLDAHVVEGRAEWGEAKQHKEAPPHQRFRRPPRDGEGGTRVYR